MSSPKHWPSIRPTSRAINNSAVARSIVRFIWGALAVLVMAGCRAPFRGSSSAAGDAAPVVKIGVIAPFEGLGRPLGYALLPEVQALVARANAAGTLGRYRVAVVAFNDDLYGPSAEAQAMALAVDPDVLAVIGPWTNATAQAATPTLVSAGLPGVSGAFLPEGQRSAPSVHTSCPSPEGLALALLDRADALGHLVAVAGPDNTLSAALLTARPAIVTLPADTTSNPPSPSDTIIHTAEAAEAADDVKRWREDGWEGSLLGGPDLAQPWFVARAGAGAAGTRALACGPATPAGTITGDSATAAAVQSARDATVAVLDALAQDVASEAAPTRAGIAHALAAQPWPGESHWLEVEGNAWRSEPASAAE